MFVTLRMWNWNRCVVGGDTVSSSVYTREFAGSSLGRPDCPDVWLLQSSDDSSAHCIQGNCISCAGCSHMTVKFHIIIIIIVINFYCQAYNEPDWPDNTNTYRRRRRFSSYSKVRCKGARPLCGTLSWRGLNLIKLAYDVCRLDCRPHNDQCF